MELLTGETSTLLAPAGSTVNIVQTRNKKYRLHDQATGIVLCLRKNSTQRTFIIVPKAISSSLKNTISSAVIAAKAAANIVPTDTIVKRGPSEKPTPAKTEAV